MAAVGAALAVPLQVALALSQSHAQAVALAEVASLGRRLQQLVEIRSVHASAGDLAPLHALCANARTQRDAALVPLVSLLSQTLAAFGRAEAALAAQQAEALAALAAVGRQLAVHAQESGGEARRLAQHPQTLELAIERQLLSSIQAELAQRAQVIAATSGSPGPLPPFAAALDQLKGEAAAALLHLEQQHAQQAAQQAAPSEQPGQQQAQQLQQQPESLEEAEQQRGQQQQQQGQQQHRPPAQQQPAAEVGGEVAQGQPAAALQGGDAQLLANSMQGLAQQLQQLQAVLVGQQQQWQQQQELQAPLLQFLHQLLPPVMHLQQAGQHQQQPALLQWQQVQSPQPGGPQHASAAAVPTGAATLRELSPAPPPARQWQQPPTSAPAAVANAADLAGDPECEAIPLSAPLAAAAAAAEADAGGMLQRAVSDAKQAAGAADAACPSGQGLLAALRGDAAPSSSSEDPAVAAAVLAAGQAPSPQKTTASAPMDGSPAAAVAGSTQNADQLQQQEQPEQPDADGKPGGAQQAFAFPQLERPSQQGHAAATPPLPADPSPLAAAAAVPAGQGSSGGGSGGGGGSLVGSPEALIAAAAAGTAAWPAGDGKENLTSSQSNSQEQVGLPPAAAVPAGKQPAAQEDGGAPRPVHAGLAGAAAASGAAQLACMVPDSEEQTLPGTQPLGEGSQPQLPITAGAPAAAAPGGQPAADHAQQAAQQHLQQQPPAGVAAAQAVPAGAQAVSAGAPTTQGTPAPSLAALLDSQRDSTSPKAVGRPGSATRPANAGAAGAAGCPLAAALAAASPVPAAGGSGGAGSEPDSGGKQRGSSGSGSGVAAGGPAVASAPCLPRPPSQEHLWKPAGEGQQRKRSASQDAERWQQKRSRFGRESQEQQQQEQQQPSAGEPQQAADQPAGEGAEQAHTQVQAPQLGQQQQQQQQAQAAAAVTDGSDPQSSSGIICTQPPASDGGMPPQTASGLLAPPGPAVQPGLGSLAALRQLWQQQHGNASPLLPLPGTPGAAQLAVGGGSPWPTGSWQPPPVAGAQPGATLRFVSPSVQGSGSATPARPTLPIGGSAAEAGASGPLIGSNLFLSLLSMHASAATAQQAPQQQAQQHHHQQQAQAQHHRLARSSSPQQEQPPGAAADGGAQ